MEEVLDLYAQPYDPEAWWCVWTRNPLCCMLNMAEIVIRVIERGCLTHLTPDLATLGERNAAHATIRWQFTTVLAGNCMISIPPFK